MSYFLKPLIYLIFIIKTICIPICEERKNNCLKCDYINQLCIKCSKDIYAPDKNGGCDKAKKCIIGNNYCLECEENSELCKICEEGYFPDENGGCSYTNNCEISDKGECIKCKNNFIMVGENTYLFEGFILCKSIFSQDFKNCDTINLRKGICSKCKEGFYLNKIDNRCIETENCLISSFGKCLECSYDYYLDKTDNKCKKQTQKFNNCLQTIDGKTCDKCKEGFYFDEENNCIEINFCSKIGDSGNCKECISGYYLSSSDFKPSCSKDQNCYEADKDSGLCLKCNENYYIDYKDGKCKSNIENNDFKFCKSARGLCNACINNYYLGEDLKCTKTKGCSESNNGICNICSDGYYLGLDNKCSLIKNCMYSKDEYNCDECEDGYYYKSYNRTCLPAENNFKNCKIADIIYENCLICKNNYYLNRSDYLCYNNEQFGNFYKCVFTDELGSICKSCEDNYYYSYKNHICSKIEGCQILKDKDTCIECEEDYCLDSKYGNCTSNYDVIEDKKYYFGCIKTNEEGTSCEICKTNLTLNENGLCIDKIHCLEEKDGICVKCLSLEEDYYYHCLNSYFGCMETIIDNCLECNDFSDFNICTKCMDGYQVDIYGDCIPIEKEDK